MLQPFPVPNAWRASLLTLTLASCLVGIFSGRFDFTRHTDPLSEEHLSRSSRDTNEVLSVIERVIILDKINHFRSNRKDASDMIKLDWNVALERLAIDWSSECDMEYKAVEHTVKEFESNSVSAYAKPDSLGDRQMALKHWFADLKKHTGKKDCKKEKECESYQELLHSASRAVGCAVKSCELLENHPKLTSGHLIACVLGPSNLRKNSQLYQKGKPCSTCPAIYRYCVKNMCSRRMYPAGQDSGKATSHYRPTPSLVTMATVLATAAVNYKLVYC